jgi:hypothetical protein
LAYAVDATANVLFEDQFEKEPHESWRWLGEDRDAWRVKDGALEIRAQPGDANTVKNALVREAPRRRDGRAYAVEVTVTNLAPPTEQYEQLGITWYHDGKPVTKFVKERIDGETYVFPGKVPMKEAAVQLRLIVRGRNIIGQYRTDGKEDYKTAFEGELPPPGERDEISLQTYHGPADAEHWMRFDDFRIVEVAD